LLTQQHKASYALIEILYKFTHENKIGEKIMGNGTTVDSTSVQKPVVKQLKSHPTTGGTSAHKPAPHPNCVHKAPAPKVNDYQRVEKAFYSTAACYNKKVEQMKTGTPGFAVYYNDNKNPVVTETRFVDRYSKDSTLIGQAQFNKNNYQTGMVAGIHKCDRSTYLKGSDGKTYLFQKYDAKKDVEYTYTDAPKNRLENMYDGKEGKRYFYDEKGGIKSICDYGKHKEYYYNGDSQLDSVMQHKGDWSDGNGKRIQ